MGERMKRRKIGGEMMGKGEVMMVMMMVMMGKENKYLLRVIV